MAEIGGNHKEIAWIRQVRREELPKDLFLARTYCANEDRYELDVPPAGEDTVRSATQTQVWLTPRTSCGCTADASTSVKYQLRFQRRREETRPRCCARPHRRSGSFR